MTPQEIADVVAFLRDDGSGDSKKTAQK